VTLLSPLSLALAGLAIPILAMYMLRIHRREQVVPSTFLWRRAVEDVQTNPRWRRVRPNLLLALQLLILAALVLALAQPAYTRARTFNGDVIAIVDQSIGMQANDVAPSRLVDALQRARQIAADLPNGSVMSVIGMGAEPHLVIAESGDRDAIDRAIDSLATISSPPNYPAALNLAVSLARRGAHTQIVILTSRDSGIDAISGSINVPVQIERFGSTLRDLGITAFHASHTGGATQAVLHVQNFGREAASSDLDLFADGQLVDVRPLTLLPGTERSESWANLPDGVRQLQARLTVSDNMAVDKVAWAVVPQPVTNRVLLVTYGDYFLQTALALAPGVKLTTLSPNTYLPAAALASDLVVFDGFLPRSVPGGPVLLVNPPRSRAVGMRFGAYLRTGSVSPVPGLTGGTASLLQYVDLSDVHVARARAVTLPAWMNAVAVSGRETLLAAGQDVGRRVALISFNLEESDWPLRLSFPVAIRNLLAYLEPGLGLAASTFQTGQPVQLFPGPGTREIDIRRPDGHVDVLSAPFLVFADTGKPGLYRAREIGVGGATSITFAVNAFGARTIAGGSPALNGPDVLRFGEQSIGSSSSGVPESLGWAFGLLALTLLSAEWWYGFKR